MTKQRYISVLFTWNLLHTAHSAVCVCVCVCVRKSSPVVITCQNKSPTCICYRASDLTVTPAHYRTLLILRMFSHTPRMLWFDRIYSLKHIRLVPSLVCFDSIRLPRFLLQHQIWMKVSPNKHVLLFTRLRLCLVCVKSFNLKSHGGGFAEET